MKKRKKYTKVTDPLSNMSDFWSGGEGINAKTNQLKEAIIGRRNFVKVDWLKKAIEACQKVAQVIKSNGEKATAFRIDQNFILTNHHVFESDEEINGARIEFDYADGSHTETWRCVPGKAIIPIQIRKDLDFALVYIVPVDATLVNQERGFLKLLPYVSPPKINEGVNIIQHPRGRTMEIAFRDNQCKFVDDVKIQYLTDTEYGSSGSPVFNDRFEVVAIHSQWVEDPNYKKGLVKTPWYRNQGFRIDQIIPHIQSYLSY